jgi:hypothetical protein
MKILRIDTTYEVLTEQASRMRINDVYPQFVLAGFTVVPNLHESTVASRADVAPLTHNADVVFITGAGHGQTMSFLGDYDEAVFAKGEYDASEVAGKVVHFLACATAAKLGHDFVDHGCRAFIGYNMMFAFQPAWASVFFRCDSQIDLALAEGKTVAEAVAKARQQFDIEIQKPGNAPIIADLQARRDNLVAIGPDLNVTLRKAS